MWTSRSSSADASSVATRPQRFTQRGIPVIEVLTSEPTTPSTAGWLRLSNRISKPDLVQVVRAVADWADGDGPRPRTRIGLPIPRRASMLTFGVTVLPDPPHTRFVELMKLAEDNGFEYGWTYDSHILWQDAYPLMTLLGDEHRPAEDGPLRHEPGDARADGDRQLLRDAPRHLRTGAWSWGSGAATRPGE